MYIKVLFLVIIVNIFYVFCVEDNTRLYVSPVLNKKPNPNWFSFGTKTYYVGTVFQANYFRAWQYCRQQKMNLLSINSREESERIERFLTLNGLKKDHFWTSATNYGDESTWVWLSTGQKFSYTNWNPGQPDNYKNEENCVEVGFVGDDGFTWNDEDCMNDLYFICESIPDCQINKTV